MISGRGKPQVPISGPCRRVGKPLREATEMLGAGKIVISRCALGIEKSGSIIIFDDMSYVFKI